MHMKSILLLFIAILLFCVFGHSVTAQLKELTADQMLHGNRNALLNELPEVGGWKDDTHYILYKPVLKHYDTVLVNVTTGKEEHYIAPDKASVYIKNNDI